jgi:hypothetical protein
VAPAEGAGEPILQRWALPGGRSQAVPMAEQVPALMAVGCALGSACLALWIVVRKPSLGPRSLQPAFLLCAIAFGLLRVTGPLMRAVVDAAGPAVALLFVVVPILAFAFWSAGVLMRAVIARHPHGGI